MITILKDSHPIARKEHTCMLCYGKIHKGQKYYRQTCVYDAAPYDWIEHEECRAAAIELDMFDDCDDEGLTDEIFRADLDQYIYDNYPEEEVDKFDTMSYYDKVCKVLNDLKKKGAADGN